MNRRIRVSYGLSTLVGGYPSGYLVALSDDVVYRHPPGWVLRKPPSLKHLFRQFSCAFESLQRGRPRAVFWIVLYVILGKHLAKCLEFPLVEDLLVPPSCDSFVLFYGHRICSFPLYVR